MGVNQLVWILEDNAGCQMIYRELLSPRYRTQFFEALHDFSTAIALTGQEHPDLIIADLKLKDGNFLDWLCAPLEPAATLKSRFIVVSSTEDMNILRVCFNAGVLDYLTKPFNENELLVKVEKILGEFVAKSEGAKVFSINVATMSLDKPDNGPLPLTPRELQIMSLIQEAPNHSLRRAEVMSKIWGDVKVASKTFDVHLFNLRRKLAKVGYGIEFHPPESFKLVERRG